MDSFSCSSFNTPFYFEQGLSVGPKYADMRYDMMTSL